MILALHVDSSLEFNAGQWKGPTATGSGRGAARTETQTWLKGMRGSSSSAIEVRQAGRPVSAQAMGEAPRCSRS